MRYLGSLITEKRHKNSSAEPTKLFIIYAVLRKLYCAVCISSCEDKQKDIAEVEASVKKAHQKRKHRENGHNDAPDERVSAALFEKSVKAHCAEAYSRESDADDVSEHSESRSAPCHGKKRPAHKIAVTEQRAHSEPYRRKRKNSA